MKLDAEQSMMPRCVSEHYRHLIGARYRKIRRLVRIWSGLRLYQRIVRGRSGLRFGRTVASPAPGLRPNARAEEPNPLEIYFDAHHEGRGIWKWRHYLKIYHHHFAKFIGSDVRVVEIGIYSGGSLEMWKKYFGSKCEVYGVDVEEACRSYEDEATRIFIGDQADATFWRGFLAEVSAVDVVVDDGGHKPHQQIATFEALFPYMRPGGVYLCEDVGGLHNPFLAYMHGLTRNLYPGTAPAVTPFQAAVDGVHYYPGVVVITKCDVPRAGLPEERRGTEWQPFLGSTGANVRV